jgi:hypothetical protein
MCSCTHVLQQMQNYSYVDMEVEDSVVVVVL